MAPKYNPPSVEAIQEVSEDEGKGRAEVRGNEVNADGDPYHRRQYSSYDPAAVGSRMSGDKHKDKSRRGHKSGANNSGKHAAKGKGKTTSSRRSNVPNVRESIPSSLHRHRRTSVNRSGDSASNSSSEEEERDHREVLAAARGRLTSPSLVSNLTSLTTATNNSGGSSGSNSTITQVSISKRSNVSKNPEPPMEGPMSPAVPDAPDVFAFLEPDSGIDDETVEGEEHESELQWQVHNEEYRRTSIPTHLLQGGHDTTSSSASSSFHSDDASEHAAEPGNETDRSTSPERSDHDDYREGEGVEEEQEEEEEEDEDEEEAEEEEEEKEKEEEEDQEQEQEHGDHGYDAADDGSVPTDESSAKLASQMQAAQERQNLHNNYQPYGIPHMQQAPQIPPQQLSRSMVLSPQHQQPPQFPGHGHHLQRPPPQNPQRAGSLPITGYELLASRLSERDGKDASIKPMYRRFEALNHRILLHLQDELCELEEQLRRLDTADTHSRHVRDNSGKDTRIVPASRRHSAAYSGPQLEWHKTDLLGRIGFKLSQYNQALASFHATDVLAPPQPEDVNAYRTYLSSEHPIAEQETHFLDPTDDLVSVRGDKTTKPTSDPPSNPSTSPSANFSSHPHIDISASFSSIATASAIAVLVPILTFPIIPGFFGRMTVVILIALGVIGASFQSGVIGQDQINGRDWVPCAMIYGGVMAVIAGFIA